jgi:hypothetical protein
MQLINSTVSFQNVAGSNMDDGKYLRTSELRQDSLEDSREIEAGREPSRRREDIAKKTTPRAIYDLLVSILQTFHLSTLGEMNRMKKKLVQNSTKPSDVGDSAKETVDI